MGQQSTMSASGKEVESPPPKTQSATKLEEQRQERFALQNNIRLLGDNEEPKRIYIARGSVVVKALYPMR
jgi:hypothetical protein